MKYLRLFQALMVVAILATISGISAPSVSAQQGLSRGQIVIWPSAGGAFPTGRFGETDLKADPPKTGHDAGYNFGVDAGYVLGENLIVGVAADYGQFSIDFGTAEQNTPGADGNTTTLVGQAWGRYFIRGGFSRWQPYVYVGAGGGNATGEVDYTTPIKVAVSDSLVDVSRIESDVSSSFMFSAGIGVLIPISDQIGLSIEPRYRTMSTKGSGRTDKLTTVDGDVFESEQGSGPGGSFRLKAKSNTDWWEIRGGVVITL